MKTFTESEVARIVEARVSAALFGLEKTHMTITDHEQQMLALRQDCVRILNQKPGALAEVARHMVEVDHKFFDDPMRDAKTLDVRVSVSGLLLQLMRMDSRDIMPLIEEITGKVKDELIHNVFQVFHRDQERNAKKHAADTVNQQAWNWRKLTS